MDSLPKDPILLVVAAALVVLAPAVRYRTAWVLAIVLFMWADSVLPGRGAALVLRAPALLALLLLGAYRYRRTPGSVRPPTSAALMAVLAAGSVLYAEDRLFAALSVVALVGLGLFVFGYLPRMVASVADCRGAFLGMTVGLLALLVVGLVPVGRSMDETSLVLGDRWRGFFANPNALGSTTAFLMPWVIALTPRERGRERALGFLAGVLVLGLCFLSGSRTAFAGLLIGASVTLWQRLGVRLVLAVTVLGMVLGFGALAGGDVDAESDTVRHLVRGQTISDFSGRLELWRIGLDLVAEKPLLGHGYKGHGFVEVVEQKAGGHVIDVQTVGVNFHSQWVEVLVDLGIPGAILLAVLLYAVGQRIARIGRGSSDPRVHGMRAALLGTHLYVVLDSFLNNWLLTPLSPPSLLYWSVIGLGLRLDAVAARESVAPLAPPDPAFPGGLPQAAPA